MACSHPTTMGNICCDCGVILEDDEEETIDKQASTQQASISMLHSIPDLKVSKKVCKS